MERVSPQELQSLIAASDPPRLIDVREPWEFEVCRIDGSVNIPMAVLQERLDTIPRGAPVVVICHHGARSLQVAQYLESLGYDPIANLEGGIDGWACAIDPDMQRY